MNIISSENVPESFFYNTVDMSPVQDSVKKILFDVQTKKDSALHTLSYQFDLISPQKFQIPIETIEQAKIKLKTKNKKLYDALMYSRDLAIEFATKQKECFTDFEIELRQGLITGQKTIPVERAGLYIPAGRFPLLSTVIMTSSPAIAAGCKDIILCTPPKLHPDDVAFMEANRGSNTENMKLKPWVDENILATAALCNINTVFAIGGAQAIAAMAYGTESIPACDVIVGPGNKYVAEAKRQVYGTVGIDIVAGPTEVFIIADDSASPEWIARDMLAQAEHDQDATAILATTSKKLADTVHAEVLKVLTTLKTAKIAEKSINNHGTIIICKNFDEAIAIANKKAPEHLELALSDTELCHTIIKKLHNYGSLFIGHLSAEVLGDYSAGLNHTLPTNRTARFTGGLSVRTFLKTVTTLRSIKKKENSPSNLSGITQSLQVAQILAEAEGLYAHAEAAKIRIQNT